MDQLIGYKVRGGLRKGTLGCFAVLSLVVVGCGERQTAQTDIETTPRYTYLLPQDSTSLYPDNSWLPDYYHSSFPSLEGTIQAFTEQTLQRDGLTEVQLDSVTLTDQGQPQLVLSGPDLGQLQDFADMHRAFLEAGVAGLAGVTACQATAGCWDPQPGQQPWAFYLPLGLSLSQQQAVTFLNYPPSDSLTDVDYLDNFTMRRWSDVLTSVGIENPLQYETIVDARPIAAPGSGQAAYMPDIGTYFNEPNSDRDYVTPMLSLLSGPASNGSSHTLPIVILGSPSRAAWASIIGEDSVGLLDVGTVTLPGADKPTAWVSGNHPDVTSYQCCPGDPHASCGGSYNLVADEQIDLQTACILQGLGNDPSADPQALKASCAAQWKDNPSAANQATTCIRARLDYSFEADGICETQAAAEAFCSYYENNACPPQVYTCDVPASSPS